MNNRSSLILSRLQQVLDAYSSGLIAAETMPEDEHPQLPLNSKELVHYLTLPMALNYQRNSYTLWKAAHQLYADPQRNYLFDPKSVIEHPFETIQSDLLTYKVALQPNKHVQTWITLCQTWYDLYEGDVRNLFLENAYDIAAIKHTLQIPHKKRFPYLSGHKIANYWLYVLTQYTSLPFTNKAALTVAPDTHVIQASVKLGLIDDANIEPQKVAQLWEGLLEGG